MKNNVRKMLSLMSELPEVDQFVLDNYHWMTDEQIEQYTAILQNGKKERLRKESHIKSLFLKLA